MGLSNIEYLAMIYLFCWNFIIGVSSYIKFEFHSSVSNSKIYYQFPEAKEEESKEQQLNMFFKLINDISLNVSIVLL